MPKISIIVPVYKVEQYLNRCVDSILNQTYKDFELILVDDGSPDICPLLCDEYAAKYDNIVVIHKENGGASAARNKGIDWVSENSNSEYITFVDSDDYISPFYLEYLLKAITECPDSIPVCSYVTFNDDIVEDGNNEYSAYQMETESFFCENKIDAILIWGKLYRKSDFINIRFPCGMIYEDEYKTPELLFKYKTVSFINIPLYFYFDNFTGVTKSEWSPKRLDTISAFEHQIKYFSKNKFSKAEKTAVTSYLSSLYMNYIKLTEDQEKNRKYLKLLKKKYLKQRIKLVFNPFLSNEDVKKYDKIFFAGFYRFLHSVKKKFSYLSGIFKH